MIPRVPRLTSAICATAIACLVWPPAAAWSQEADAAAGPPFRYVALGDSFASGESVRPYDPATDIPENRCHRSELAYPEQLADEHPAAIDLVAFRACSGATTANVTSVAQYPTQPPQLADLPADVDILSISVGGNDIGFADFAQACALGANCGGPDSVTAVLAAIDGPLATALAGTYTALRDAVGPDTAVFVIGYPHLVAMSGQGSGCIYLSARERTIIRYITVKLNAAIGAAAAEAGFYFVNPLIAQSPFVGHELCTDDSYFTNIFSSAPFHPNAKGQNAYQDLLTGYLLASGVVGHR